MEDAAPNPIRGRTRYEVAAVNELTGDSVVVGFTPRLSRAGLIAAARARGDELVELVDPSDEPPEVYRRGDTPYWEMDVGRGWKIRFTGRTEREVASAPLLEVS